MATGNTGLGKGLSALIRETTTQPEQSVEIHRLPIKNIIPNKDQPRRSFLPTELEELAASIKSQGLLQPILVRPLKGDQQGKYEIVAGERRWRAATLAGLAEVPVFVRSLTDEETLTAALIENIQRENLNPIEEALAIQTLKDSFHLSQEDLATRLGKSRSAIANTTRLLSLSEKIQTEIIEKKISSGHARALLSITDNEVQQILCQKIISAQLSVREAEDLATQWKKSGDISALLEQQELNETIGRSLGQQQKKKKEKSLFSKEIENQLNKTLGLTTKVSGKEEKGKITFYYNSVDELEKIMEKIKG